MASWISSLTTASPTPGQGEPGPGAPLPFAEGRIPSLDGFRAVAILLVIVFHVAKTRNCPLPRALYWYAAQGSIGVDVFFAISGFLITTLLLREHDRAGTISLRGFFARRAVRILPACLTYLAVMAVFSRLGWIHLYPRDWAAALTYTVNFFHAVSAPLGHLWSLSVEEHFYLIWPPLFVMLGVSRAAGAALVCLFAEPIVRWLTYRYAGAHFDIDFATFTRLDAIAAGCLMAIAGRFAAGRLLLARLDCRPAAWFFGSLIVLAVSCLVLSRIGKYTIVAKPFVNALAICVMIWTAARFPVTSFGRLLNWSPLAWLGRLSYSLYLWQQVFLDPGNGARWMCRFPQNLCLSLAAAVASYYLIELPFLGLKKSQLRARRDSMTPPNVSLTPAVLQPA